MLLKIIGAVLSLMIAAAFVGAICPGGVIYERRHLRRINEYNRRRRELEDEIVLRKKERAPTGLDAWLPLRERARKLDKTHLKIWKHPSPEPLLPYVETCMVAASEDMVA